MGNLSRFKSDVTNSEFETLSDVSRYMTDRNDIEFMTLTGVFFGETWSVRVINDPDSARSPYATYYHQFICQYKNFSIVFKASRSRYGNLDVDISKVVYRLCGIQISRSKFVNLFSKCRDIEFGNFNDCVTNQHLTENLEFYEYMINNRIPFNHNRVKGRDLSHLSQMIMTIDDECVSTADIIERAEYHRMKQGDTRKISVKLFPERVLKNFNEASSLVIGADGPVMMVNSYQHPDYFSVYSGFRIELRHDEVWLNDGRLKHYNSIMVKDHTIYHTVVIEKNADAVEAALEWIGENVSDDWCMNPTNQQEVSFIFQNDTDATFFRLAN